MPTYRSINVELHSQFDVETIPEYCPRSQSYYAKQGVTATVPDLIDDVNSTCSVYIPVLPGSQFWISHSISPPVPEDQLFLFKLFINSTYIVSWSCGKTEGWKGKTMFGLFEREAEEGHKRIEKRALHFTAPEQDGGEWKDVEDAFDENAFMEIRVHRAHGRKRIEKEVETYAMTEHAKTERGIHLVNAGRAGSEMPKRFYKFALIDPVDQPFASFRYYYRTWHQLQELGLFNEESEVSGSSVNDEEADNLKRKDMPNNGLDDGNGGLEDVFSTVRLSDDEDKGISARSVSAPHERTQERHSRMVTPPQLYRLSVPPNLKFEPPKPPSQNLPSIPQKSNSYSSLAYRPHPAYPVEQWIARTPSPVKSVREAISSPAPGKRRVFTATSLISVISNAWRRRGTPTSECENDMTGRDGMRNVSC